MAIDLIHINKLLRLMYFDERQLRSALVKDIYQDKIRGEGGDTGGGDFYSPFWSDARRHILGEADLFVLTTDRVNKNGRRAKLYFLLQHGVSTLWERGHNLNVTLLSNNPKGRYSLSDSDLTVKAERILGLKIEGQERLVYPYWFPDPVLSEEAARVGLWLLSQALPYEHAENIRIFDIIRAEYFSLAECPLQGNEEQILRRKYSQIQALRERLLIEREDS